MSKGKTKNTGRITVYILLALLLVIAIPILFKCSAIKSLVAWWLQFTENPDYKIAYIEMVVGIAGTFLSLLGALRIENYLRNREKKEETRENARILHGELVRCFTVLKEIHKETSIKNWKTGEKVDTTTNFADFADAYCQNAKKYRLNLNDDWVSALAKLNGQIDSVTWDRLNKYSCKLSVIDQSLQSGEVEKIREVYIAFICHFITPDGSALYADIESMLSRLEALFKEN